MDRQENNLSDKQVRKTPSTVRSALRWLFVGILAFLLVLAIIFQAPWKVATLLVIFLLACTALPKPFRKWFWLSVGAVVIALIVWVFLPDRNGDWRPYTFDEELAALQAKYAIPDEENAAVIYNQLLARYDANAFEPEFMDSNLEDLTRREPWSSQDYPELAQWLKSRQDATDALLQASRFEKCRFPIPVPADPVSFRRSMKRLASLRRWALLLIRAANNDLGDNRIEPALEKCFAILQLGNHIRQQPPLSDALVGIAVEALAMNVLQRFTVAGHATQEHLNTIEKALAAKEHNWCVDFPKVLEYEKLLTKNDWCMAYQINPKGKIRLSRDPLAAWAPFWDQQSANVPKLTYWQKKLLKANTIVSWLYMPSDPHKVAAAIDAGYERLHKMAEPDFDWQKTPRKSSFSSVYATPIKAGYLIRFKNYNAANAFVNVSDHTYHKLHDNYLRVIAVQRGCQILIALRRYKNKHGAWPDNLSDIQALTTPDVFIDPTNTGPFVYKLTEENFTLYSKGKNNIDEDGKDQWSYDAKRDRWSYMRTGADDWLIWPKRTKGKH